MIDSVSVTLVHPNVKLIAEMDAGLLKTLRQYWIDARDPKDKEKWRKRLDDSLDERIRLMREMGSI